MNIVFATMPRSGSEFLIRLTQAVVGPEMPKEILPITPGRIVDTPEGKSRELTESIAAGTAMDYFKNQEPICLKIESPGADTLCYDLACHYPKTKWLGSLRKLEKIFASHHNIKSWGWPEEKLLRAYVQDLAFYEYMAAEDRLFLVNIDEAARFSTEKMLAFLDRTEAGKHSADFVENWRVVNPLKKQQSQQGEEETREERPGLDLLRERHPWINAIEARYHRLWEASV